jgi:undecaprenyl-diphosphatase
MELIQVIVLALVQGITEFLPISSSAHLILVPALMGWPDQGLAFDVAVHIGTLAAVLIYFRSELLAMTRSWLVSLRGRGCDTDARLAWMVVLATAPVVVAGVLGKDFIESELRSIAVLATTTIIFGLLLGWADWRGRRERDEYSLGWGGALLIGAFQTLALIPGTSRAGITLTAGLLLGLTRPAAARFAFLLAIPTTAASGVLLTRDLLREPAAVDWGVLGLGAVLAGLSAYLCIVLLLRMLRHTGLMPFVIYRLFMGGVLWLWFI